MTGGTTTTSSASRRQHIRASAPTGRCHHRLRRSRRRPDRPVRGLRGALAYRHNLAFTAAGQVRINDIAGADLIVEVNTGGTLAADMQIRLTGTTLASMAASDFFL